MTELKAVSTANRLVANIHTDAPKPLLESEFEGYVGCSALAADDGAAIGTGFHVFKMEPGSKTVDHLHQHDEHFFLASGDLSDHDGYEYSVGDIVMMRAGTRHWSSTRSGCTLVAYVSAQETD